MEEKVLLPTLPISHLSLVHIHQIMHQNMKLGRFLQKKFHVRLMPLSMKILPRSFDRHTPRKVQIGITSLHQAIVNPQQITLNITTKMIITITLMCVQSRRNLEQSKILVKQLLISRVSNQNEKVLKVIK